MKEVAEDITNYKVQYEQLHEKYDILVHELAQLKKMFFGSRQERFIASDDKKPTPQLSLGLDVDTIAQCKITATTEITYTRTKTEAIDNKPKAHPGRKPPSNTLLPIGFNTRIFVRQKLQVCVYERMIAKQ